METPSSLRPSQGPRRAPSCPSLREQQGEITGVKEGVHTNPYCRLLGKACLPQIAPSPHIVAS